MIRYNGRLELVCCFVSEFRFSVFVWRIGGCISSKEVGCSVAAVLLDQQEGYNNRG